MAIVKQALSVVAAATCRQMILGEMTRVTVMARARMSREVRTHRNSICPLCCNAILAALLWPFAAGSQCSTLESIGVCAFRGAITAGAGYRTERILTLPRRLLM